MRHNLAVQEAFETPRQTFPDRERGFVQQQYQAHDVILEYGAGGSTLMAAEQQHSLVMAVENDRRWAKGIKQTLTQQFPDKPVHVHWVDTGPTMMWGRPKPKSRGDSWRNYPKYALEVWDKPFFRHPDLVMIDGRFRTACFLTTMMRITRPVTVLFDDYTNRAAYHWIERYAAPLEICGRMARFGLVPQALPPQDLSRIIDAFLDSY